MSSADAAPVLHPHITGSANSGTPRPARSNTSHLSTSACVHPAAADAFDFRTALSSAPINLANAARSARRTLTATRTTASTRQPSRSAGPLSPRTVAGCAGLGCPGAGRRGLAPTCLGRLGPPADWLGCSWSAVDGLGPA